MKLYKAPNPYTSQKKSNSIILTRLSRFLGQFILAAQGRKPTKWLADQTDELTKKYPVNIQNLGIMTHDKALLDTVILPRKNGHRPLKTMPPIQTQMEFCSQ